MNSVVSKHEDNRLSYTKYIVGDISGGAHGTPTSSRSLSLLRYSIGFALSIILTVVAYVIAVHGTSSATARELILAVLAVVQFATQMLLFLHVGEEKGPKLKLLMAGLMLAIVLILVGGSLWVMHSLNYRMMGSPEMQTQYLQDQDGGI